MSSVELKAAVAAERAAPSAAPDTEEDEEDRTVQASAPASTKAPVAAPAQAAPPAPPSRPGPPRPGPPRAGSSSSVAAKPARAPSRPEPPPADADEGDELDDSITATAPRVPGTPLGLGVPGKVEIRTMNSDDLTDETEVATMTGSAEALLAAAERAMQAQAQASDDDDDDGPTTQAVAPVAAEARARGAAASPPSPVADDDDDDGDTTQALAPRVGSTPDLVRISTKSLIEEAGPHEISTRPGVGSGNTLTGDLPTKPGVGRSAPAAEDDYADDSVTTQAPLGTAALEALETNDIPTMDGLPKRDDTDATTQKKSKPPASPADGEPESVTAQAPNLTNMLRVIASDRQSAIEPDDEDQLPENKTAVMAQAPMKQLKQPGTLQGMGPVHVPPRQQPTSESAMRVAVADPMQGDKASLGAIFGADMHVSRASFDGGASDGRMRALAEPAFPPPPLLHDEDGLPPRTPQYGLLVGVVAIISLAVPVTLYLYLSHASDDLGPPRAPAQVAPDFVGHGEIARPKASPKGAASSKRSPLRR